MGKFKITQTPASKNIYLYPEDNGCVNECFPIGDMPNWRCVDDLEDALEPETTHVWMDGASTISELYTMGNHGTITGTINYVKAHCKAKNYRYPPHIDATYKIAISNNSVCSYYAYSGNMPLCTGYGLFEYAWQENPWTVTDWTWDDVDDLQQGFECSSPAVVMSPFPVLPTDDGDRTDITNVTTGYEHWEAIEKSRPYAEVFETGAAWKYDLYQFIKPSNDPLTYSDAGRGQLLHNGYVFAGCSFDGFYIHRLTDDNKFEFILRLNDGKAYNSVTTDGTYYYAATNLGTFVYTFDGETLTEITSVATASQYVYYYGGYLYVGEATNIAAYSFNGSTLTPIDTQAVTGNVAGIYHDGSYVYVSTNQGMMYAMSFDGANFVSIDSDNTAFLLGDNIYRIDGDGTYIYAPAMTDGIYAYSFDGVTLTHITKRDDGDTYAGVACNNGYIFVLKDGVNDYIVAHTFDGAAFSAVIDTYTFGVNAHSFYEVRVSDNFIICDWTSTQILTFSGSGFERITNTAEDNTPKYLDDNITSVTVIAKMGKDLSADDQADIRGCFIIKTGGNEFNTSADYFTLESKQRYYVHTWTENPDTLAAWTLAEVQALQAGIGLYGTGTKYAICSRCYISLGASSEVSPEIHTCQSYLKVNYSPDDTVCWMPKPQQISTNHARNVKMINFWNGEREVYDVNRSGKSMVLTGKITDRKGGGAWCDTDYAFRKKITIDHTQVDGDLVDFPVYLDINLNKKCLNANGYDVMFCDNSCSEYSFEIENYSGDGKLKVWVKVPAVSSTVDTVFWIYYRKSGVTIDPSSTDVWDDYGYVFHMTNDPDNSHMLDSANANIATKVAGDNGSTEVNSNMYKGQEFDGIDDEMTVPHDATINSTDPFYISLWLYKEDDAPESTMYICDQGTSHANRNYQIAWSNGTEQIIFKVRDAIGGADRYAISATNQPHKTWLHVLCVYDGSNVLIWVNGVPGVRSDATPNPPATNTVSLKIARLAYNAGVNNYRYYGKMDEFRFGKAVLADPLIWAKAEIANQKAGSTFVSYGNRQENYITNVDACAQIICVRNMTRDGTVVTISGLNPTYFNGEYRINSFGWNKISEKPENYDWILELESAY